MSSPDPPPIPGYLLHERVDRDSDADVWRATDRLTGAGVALKVASSPAHNGGWQSRLLAERDLLSRVDHHHVARLLQSGVTEHGRPWLALQWIEGETLNEWLDPSGQADDPPAGTLRDAMTWIAGLSRGTHALHTAGWVHGGLEPNDVIIERDSGRAVLIDCGGGWNRSEGDSDPAANTIDVRSDVFSLGSLSLRLAGERVLPPELTAVLDKARAPDPGARHASAAKLADDLEAWLAGRPPEAWWERLGFRRRLWIRMVRQPLASLALALALSGLLLFSASLVRGAVLEKRRSEALARALDDTRHRQIEALRFARLDDIHALVERAGEHLDRSVRRHFEAVYREDGDTDSSSREERIRAAIVVSAIDSDRNMEAAAVLVENLPAVDWVEFAAVKQSLWRIGPTLLKRLWQNAEDPSLPPPARVSALLVLALHEPPQVARYRRPQWEKCARELAPAIVNVARSGSQPQDLMIGEFANATMAVAGPVVAEYEASEGDPRRRRAAANLLFGWRSKDSGINLRFYLAADSSEGWRAHLLLRDHLADPGVRKRLRGIVFGPGQTHRADYRGEELRTRCAVSLLLAGEAGPLVRLIDRGIDGLDQAGLRNQIILRLGTMRLEPEDFLRAGLRDAEAPALRRAILWEGARRALTGRSFRDGSVAYRKKVAELEPVARQVAADTNEAATVRQAAEGFLRQLAPRRG